jgi:hypothetical protein
MIFAPKRIVKHYPGRYILIVCSNLSLPNRFSKLIAISPLSLRERVRVRAKLI